MRLSCGCRHCRPRPEAPVPTPPPKLARDPAVTAEGLDATYYADIFDMIVEHADHGALLALRGACRELHSRCDQLLVRRVISTGMKTRALAWISPGGRIPRKNWMDTDLVRHVKRVDLHQCPERIADVYEFPRDLDILCCSVRRGKMDYSLDHAKVNVRSYAPESFRERSDNHSHLIMVKRQSNDLWSPERFKNLRLLSLTVVLWHLPAPPTGTGVHLTEAGPSRDDDVHTPEQVAAIVSYTHRTR